MDPENDPNQFDDTLLLTMLAAIDERIEHLLQTMSHIEAKLNRHEALSWVKTDP
jgi:hypothetical protein